MKEMFPVYQIVKEYFSYLKVSNIFNNELEQPFARSESLLSGILYSILDHVYEQLFV